MRVWGLAHPAYLGSKHLLGEHVENHQLLNATSARRAHPSVIAAGGGSGWMNHPEAARFDGENGRLWLIVRHELLRLEMLSRFGPQHAVGKHGSPAMGAGMRSVELQWIEVTMMGLVRVLPPDFTEAIRGVGFPPTRLEHDTPWDRDGQSLEEYIDTGAYGGGQRHQVVAQLRSTA